MINGKPGIGFVNLGGFWYRAMSMRWVVNDAEPGEDAKQKCFGWDGAEATRVVHGPYNSVL
jgi:hypothetical protein